MTIAISMLALIGLVQVVKYIYRSACFWTLRSKLQEAIKETEDYCDKGMVLNAHHGLRRVKLIAAEMEKYK